MGSPYGIPYGVYGALWDPLRHMERCYAKVPMGSIGHGGLWGPMESVGSMGSPYGIPYGVYGALWDPLRHMERCYAKVPMGSIGATRLFCDVYNPQSRTYCKRLQVLCPEHSREPKGPADEVCGCPLVRDVFELTGDFCRVPKRRCHRHYCWEKLRRAEVDLERVRVVRMEPCGHL
ncbi:PREDICTED: CXXC-type zinc finger protein 1 [Tinamus guttatus]|uniref:CXXC-type zinc finger protein 1 n=1 Tax=Tinamus guttatus TaxID=94827 RepID=UPI00052EBB07|nr:PREDICTED: CXXC-type zinc finger protein 1 [Tinamus guttatus]